MSCQISISSGCEIHTRSKTDLSSRQLHSTPNSTGDVIVTFPMMGRRKLPIWWSSSLLPLAIATSATNFAYLNLWHPSIRENLPLFCFSVFISLNKRKNHVTFIIINRKLPNQVLETTTFVHPHATTREAEQ